MLILSFDTLVSLFVFLYLESLHCEEIYFQGMETLGWLYLLHQQQTAPLLKKNGRLNLLPSYLVCYNI